MIYFKHPIKYLQYLILANNRSNIFLFHEEQQYRHYTMYKILKYKICCKQISHIYYDNLLTNTPHLFIKALLQIQIQLILISQINIYHSQIINTMNKQPQQSKPIYYFPTQNNLIAPIPKTVSSKNNSLNVSIGAHQTAGGFLKVHRTKSSIVDYAQKPQQVEVIDKPDYNLQTLSKQNMNLRQQNQHLKLQIQRLRTRTPENHSKKYSVSPSANNDLRGTIKKEKQMVEMKQMRKKIEMLSKQCKMYEEIIEKMEERISKLTQQNTKHAAQVDDLHGQLAKFQQLKDKINGLMSLYSELESKFNSDQLQWMKWRQSWLTQKEHYLLRIRQLQKIIHKGS